MNDIDELRDTITSLEEDVEFYREREKKLRMHIFSLYEKADHLGHEDTRNSCAYILSDIFGMKIEEGQFGGMFLTAESIEILKKGE